YFAAFLSLTEQFGQAFDFAVLATSLFFFIFEIFIAVGDNRLEAVVRVESGSAGFHGEHQYCLYAQYWSCYPCSLTAARDTE
ncbi:hypothetical protein, partial [Marinobacter alexandrii]|uniref:hypothetical protein n=1 Tax=Marinobacter alexandrii TaxID=2570351 RepID=UPI0032973BEC